MDKSLSIEKAKAFLRKDASNLIKSDRASDGRYQGLDGIKSINSEKNDARFSPNRVFYIIEG